MSIRRLYRMVKLLGVAVPCGLLAVAAAWAQDLHVEGTISYTCFATNGIKTWATARQFILDAAADKWVVRTVPLTNAPGSRERWSEAAGDGTNIYSLLVLAPPPTNAAPKGRFPARRLTYDTGLGEVWQTSVPYSDYHLAAPVWLAFVKGASQPAPGRFKPFWYADETISSPKVGLQAYVQTNTAAPYLPQQAWFISSGKEAVRVLGKVLLVSGHPHAYTNAIYTASNFVAVGQLSLPKSFTLEVYSPDGRGKGALYRSLRYEGTASVFSAETAHQQFPPALQIPTLVEDYRVPEGRKWFRLSLDEDEELPHLTYSLTNRWITSTNDPRFGEAVRRNQSKGGGTPRL